MATTATTTTTITLNFLLHRINYLPYYLPIAIQGLKYENKSQKEEGKKQYQVNFFLEKAPQGKDFIDPFYPKHLKEIMNYSKRCGFKVLPLSSSNLELHDGRKTSSKVLYFVGEGNIVGIKDKTKPPEWYLWIDKSPKSKLISLVVNFEFAIFLEKYIKYVDYVVFPSEKYIEYYLEKTILGNTYKKKFIALGSPKYDSQIQEKEKMKKPLELLHYKYSLPEFQEELEPYQRDKYILIVFPKDPQKHKKSNTLYPKFDHLIKLYQILRNLGYKIIVKNRFQDSLFENKSVKQEKLAQDKTLKALKGDYYIEDVDYMVTNSMELIRVAELGIFFSSSISEEFVALEKPYIDLKVDLSKNRFPFYNQEHNSRVIPYNVLFSKKDIQIEELLNMTIKQLIKNMKENNDFPERDQLLNLSSGSSEKILKSFA